MFICKERCIEKYEGPAVDWAKAMDRGSLGPCEICRKTGVCYDIPSSANWRRKSSRA